MTNPTTTSDQLGGMIRACFTTAAPEVKRTENKEGDNTIQFVARCRADAEFVGEQVKAMARALNGQIVKSTPNCIVVTGASSGTNCEIRLEIDRSKAQAQRTLSDKSKNTSKGQGNKAALAN